jgi:hypothetical protein
MQVFFLVIYKSNVLWMIRFEVSYFIIIEIKILTSFLFLHCWNMDSLRNFLTKIIRCPNKLNVQSMWTIQNLALVWFVQVNTIWDCPGVCFCVLKICLKLYSIVRGHGWLVITKDSSQTLRLSGVKLK